MQQKYLQNLKNFVPVGKNQPNEFLIRGYFFRKHQPVVSYRSVS